MIAGLRGEDSIAELCRKEGINQNLYYRWSKDFLEAGKKRLAGDTAREATSDEVKGSRRGGASAQGAAGRGDDREPPAQKKRTRRMGSPIHEISRRREAGDHPAGRAVVVVGAAHPGPARHPALHLLRLVRALSGARRRGPGRWPAGAAPRLEQAAGHGRGAVVELALKEPELSPRELAVSFIDQQQYFVSESSVYRLLKAHDLITSPAFILMKAADSFAHPTTAPNQLWQTDFTYLRVIGWGWFYLSTVLDDFSRYILAWKLCTTMTATDVSDTLTMALRSSGLERVRVRHRPRLLSDNGPSYLSAQLGSWLAEHGMTHTRGKPYHPMTQGKIERYHRSMKNQILLENYYLPGQLEQRLAEFVDYYNLRRYHESLDNLTPADIYFGRGRTILTRRENIKLKTIELRRRLHHQSAATTSTQMGQTLS